MIIESLVALAGSVFALLGSDGEAAGLKLRTLVVDVGRCSCTPSLVVDGWTCQDNLMPPQPQPGFRNCFEITISDGETNNPTCNAFEGCETLQNCDAKEGEVVLRQKCTTCTIACTNIEALLGGSSQGSLPSTSSGSLSFPIGGSAVACTNVDNQEGTGDTIVIRWVQPGQNMYTYSCSAKVYDKCTKCSG